MGMLRRNVLLVGIGAVVAVVIVVVIVLFVGGVFVGGGGGSSDLQNLILEDSNSVAVVSVTGILAAEEIPAQLEYFVQIRLPRITEDYDAVDWKDDWRDEWDATQREFGFVLDEVDEIMQVSGSYDYLVLTGSFLMGDLRDSLEDAGYEDDQYRDQEIWQRGGTAVALMEVSGKSAAVAGGVDDVQEVLKAIDRGDGFLDNEAELKMAIDKAGGYLAYFSNTSCSSRFFRESLRGCEAIVESITGGDPDTTFLSGTYVFSSESRSESGARDLEDGIEDQRDYDADVDDIGVSGPTVSYEATVYER